MTPEFLIQLLAFVGVMLGGGFVLIKILDNKSDERMGRIEENHKQEMDSIRQDLTAHREDAQRQLKQVNERVNDVKDTFTRQDIHDKDINLLRESHVELRNEIRSDIRNSFMEVNQNLGQLRNDFTQLLMDIVAKLGKESDHQ